MSLAHQIMPAKPVDRVERTPPMGIRWHEFADIFPWIEGPARDELKADIAKNGVLEPIVFLDGAILDGRNRYDIARELGIEYPRVEYQGNDPLGFVISHNLKRRHLTDKQRADVAAKLAKLPKGSNQHTPIGGPSVAQAAQLMDVPVKAVERAKTVQEHATPEVKAAYDAGHIAPSVAADIASLPPEQQVEIIKQADPKALRAVVKQARTAQQAAKKEKRAEREAVLAEKIQALPDKRYGVIVADPEWRFEPYSRETGMDRSADNHYPTSSVEQIKTRDVQSIAADDCVLFLWATAPMLPQALDVLAAWGFTYKTHAIWFKRRAGEGRGTGYWFLGEHEILLVGVRGNVVPPAMGMQFRSVFEAPVGAHSEKPDIVLEMVEAYFPNLPKIELNRRGPARPGWDAWGNEAEGAAA